MILEVDEIQTYYGTSHVLFGVSLVIQEGEVVSILGRNGAGKTTTLRSIMGLTPPRSGGIKFKDKEVAGKAPDFIARLGMGFVPDGRIIFPDLTVRENLDIAVKKSNSGQQSWSVEKVYKLFPKLQQLETHMGAHLSGGEAQMLTIARTLMGNPDLLLLDEPVEGLAPLVVAALKEQVHHLKKEKMTILMCEQNIKFATDLSDRVCVMDKGGIRFQGTITELSENDEIKKRYLTV